MKFQDGFKKKLVQTDFQLNIENELMILRKKEVSHCHSHNVTAVTVGPRVEEFLPLLRRSRQLTMLHVGPAFVFRPAPACCARWHRRRRL